MSMIHRTEAGSPPRATARRPSEASLASACSTHCDAACARKSSPGNCGSSSSDFLSDDVFPLSSAILPGPPDDLPAVRAPLPQWAEQGSPVGGPREGSQRKRVNRLHEHQGPFSPSPSFTPVREGLRTVGRCQPLWPQGGTRTAALPPRRHASRLACVRLSPWRFDARFAVGRSAGDEATDNENKFSSRHLPGGAAARLVPSLCWVRMITARDRHRSPR